MPSLSELEARYNAFHEKEVHYLADLNKGNEEWKAENEGCGA
jgi:hypothetical protein